MSRRPLKAGPGTGLALIVIVHGRGSLGPGGGVAALRSMRDALKGSNDFAGVHTSMRAMPADKYDSLLNDAERYRYLRGRDLGAIHQGGVFAGQTPQNLVLNGEDLDVAVDRAMGMPW